MHLTSTEVKLYKWNSGWGTAIVTQNRSFGTGPWFIRCGCANSTSSGGQVGTIKMSETYVTSYDYSSRIP